MLRFILNFIFFGVLFYAIYAWFPDAFNTIVGWAKTIYDFIVDISLRVFDWISDLTKPGSTNGGEAASSVMVALSQIKAFWQ